MRIPRLYEPQELTAGGCIALNEQNSAHVCRVLRLRCGDQCRVFDGAGHEFAAEITETGRRVQLHLLQAVDNHTESPVFTILGQVISRGEKMDFTIQKAVELGIGAIYPLTSERCGVKLDPERLSRKTAGWQKTAAAACEQCGRAVVPRVFPATSLSDFCTAMAGRGLLRLTLDPASSLRIKQLPPADEICLLIGPEGGFSREEVELSASCGFTAVSLGPRILRTETAALTALSMIGSHFGDL